MATNYNTHLSSIQPHTWKIAFIFAFLALLVDGADLMLLSYSLNRALLHKPICKGFFSDIIFK